MTDAQLAGILRQATADAVAKVQTAILRQMKKEHAEIRKELGVLRRIIADGEEVEYPWFDYKQPKMRQIQAVFEYLKEHPNRDLYTVPRAVREKFARIPGGYKTTGALQAACYRCRVALYAL